MPIIRMFSSSAVVFIAIAACVAGAPVQNQGENIGLNNEVYSQPELAEALARTYEAMEWQRNHDRGEKSEGGLSRNLDHIGGGNLLRNLDHIGGGNLLRSVTSMNEPDLNYELFGGQDSFREMNNEPYRQSRSVENSHANLDPLGGPNTVGLVSSSGYARNLDHIGGGNLLRHLEIEPYSETDLYERRRAPVEAKGQFDNRRSQSGRRTSSDSRGTLDSLGGPNFVRRDAPNEYERNLDHIGGSNLLRDVQIEGNSRGRPMISTVGTSDSLPGSNLVELASPTEYARNLDHIGGGNLLRDLEVNPAYSENGPYRRRRASVEGESANRRNQLGKKNSSDSRGTLDSLGGPNFVRRAINDANKRGRNLDHIGGGNLLRQLDPLAGPNFV